MITPATPTNPGMLINTVRSFVAGRWPILQRFLGRQRPERWIGLDVGSQSIKLVELEQVATGVRVVNSLIQERPTAQSSPLIDREEWLQAALKEFGAKEIHLAVAGSAMAIRRVRVPPMSRGELVEAVKWQAKDELPFPIHEAVLDFEVLGEMWDKDVKKLDVLVAAAPRDFVQEQIALVERAGSQVASVIPTHLALWYTVRGLGPHQVLGSVALVELGAEQTHVVILKDGRPRVARDIPIGSAHLTQAMAGIIASEQGELKLDLAKAEQIKRQYGILTEAVEGATEEGFPLLQLAALMRSVLENLLTELARFFDFYKVQLEESGVGRILLCGGGAGLKHMQAFLGDGLAVKVDLHNPALQLESQRQAIEDVRLSDGDPRLAVALGTALAHGQGPDLTPPELKTRRRQATVTRFLNIAIPRIGSLAVLLYVMLHLVSWSYGRKVSARQIEWQRVEPTYRHYMTIATEAKQLDGIVATLRGFIERQPHWEGIFKEVSQFVPATIELTELTATKAPASTQGPMQLHLKGTVALTGSGAEGALAQFLEVLEASVFFRDVRLASSQVQSGAVGMTTFEILCSLE